MRKELVVSIFAILMITLFTSEIAQATDPNVSVQPRLIQDETMKPGDPPFESHPTAHQYNAPLTNPGNAYDNNQMTYSLTNITQQPYPSVYSRPTAYSGNASVTTPGNAYDLNPLTSASIDITAVYPDVRDFTVQTFNSTLISYSPSSIDIKMNYTFTIASGNCNYTIVLYVGSKSVTLQSVTNTTQTTPTVRTWIDITEPNDGVWTKTDVDNMRISIYTQKKIKQNSGTFKVYEVWARVYPPNVRYFAVQTFSPTSISSYSYLDVKMNYTAIMGSCSYRILISVGSANTTVLNWMDVSQVTPDVATWERVTEPKDGWWNQTDLSSMRIIIETQKTSSQFNNGELKVYEAWVDISPPTASLYPSNHEGDATVTNPSRAYDKNQITYASVSLPIDIKYFAVKSFNTTTPSEYASIDIQMRYSVTTFGGGQYKIYVYVSEKSVDLQPPTDVNQTEPITMIWHGVCEPNDAVWSQTDLSNLQIRVEKAVPDGTCTFQEYETWLTILKDSLTVRVYVTGVLVSSALYAWMFNLTFNPNVLQVVTVADGPFLKQAGFTNFAGFTIDPTAGWVYAGSALDDWWSGGASGSGALATVTFNVIAKGNSMFNFSDTQLRTFDEGTGMPKGLLHTNSPGWFQYLAGDVNGDAKVNHIDLYQVGKAYGSSSSGPNWLNADLNKDGTVSQSDLSLVAADYGKT